MDRYRSMLAFLRVAEHSSFASAARSLGISTSAVSRQVTDLEDWLDIQLFNRTTRHVSLTGAGNEYLNECRQLVAGMDSLEAMARERVESLHGRLRITAPVFLGKEMLGPLLPGFLERYSGIQIELQLIDRFVNLVEEGFDIAMRVGELPDSTMIARKISGLSLSIVASPDYVEKYGEPKTVTDLRGHNCLIDTAPRHGPRWPIDRKSTKTWQVSGNFVVNSGELVRDLAIAGTGVTLLPTFFVKDLIDDGALVTLLEDQISSIDAGVYFVYPQSKHVSRAVRAFIDYVVAFCKSHDGIG